MDKIEILVKKLTEDAVIPKYAHDGDVGMDFIATDVEYDIERDCYIYHTGLAFESEKNIGQFLFVRSSNRNTDAYLANHVGIADCAIYRGEILFCYKNRESLEQKINTILLNKMLLERRFPLDEEIKEIEEMVLEEHKQLKYAPYKRGDKIGQTVFLKYPTIVLKEVDTLSDSERGTDGFGSSGK